MTTPLKIWSAAEVAGNFAGIQLKAENDDEFVSISKDDDNFTYKGGVNGFGTRSRTSQRKYTVTLNLPQTSPTNQLLTPIHLADLAKDGNGLGVGKLTFSDTNGTTVFGGQEAWIIKMPDWRAAAESDTVAWVFHVHDGKFNLGGN